MILEGLVAAITLFFIICGIYFILLLNLMFKFIRQAFKKQHHYTEQYNNLRKEMEWVADHGSSLYGMKCAEWLLPILPYTKEQILEMIRENDTLFLYRQNMWCKVTKIDVRRMSVYLKPCNPGDIFKVPIQVNDRIHFCPEKSKK